MEGFSPTEEGRSKAQPWKAWPASTGGKRPNTSNSITMNPNFAVASGGTFTAQIGGYLQTVNFRYNIRGQLVNINNPTLKDDTGKTSNESTDLFGMQLFYDNPDSKLTGTTPSYTGRISAVEWMSRNGSNAVTNERSDVYSYDQLGRYTGSKYAELAPGQTSFITNMDGFDENNISYDDGGNILTMQRTSSSIGATSHVKVDSLTYGYDSTLPNQLDKVSDGTGANFTSLGFRNYTGSTSSYTYDNEGNLSVDPYKALNLKYNVLNKPDSISCTATGSNNAYVSYTYDASGNVLRKQVWTNSTTLQSTSDYIDGLVYTTTGSTTVLSYFAMPEGRVVNTNGTLAPEYVITDQQGNARFSFANDGNGGIQIRQENSYYGMGENLSVSTVSPLPATPNINLYNGGSEWQNEFSNLLDYHQTFFRNYDPAIGRFIASDPMPESAESMTTYQYAGNNAVMGNDPMGDVNLRGRGYVPALPGGEGGGEFSDEQIAEGDAFINDIAGYTAQQEAADGDDSGGGDGGGDSNNSSGVDPYVYDPTSLASSPYYGSNVYRPNGQTIHIDDGSNADYLELPGQILEFTGYSDQGGTDTRNIGTGLVYPFILASGNYTFALDEVNIYSTATGHSANSQAMPGWRPITPIAIDYSYFKNINDVNNVYGNANKINTVIGSASFIAALSRNARVAKVGRFFGPATFIAGEGLDAWGLLHDNITWGKAGENLGFNALGLTDIGYPISAGYFYLDNFYQGGFEGAEADFQGFEESQIQYNNQPDGYENVDIGLASGFH